MGRGIDDKCLKGKPLAMPFQGPIMERLTTADMCVMGPTDKNKHDKIGKTSWDTTTYALVMAHNVYNHIQAIQEINRLADIEYATQKEVSFRAWHKSDKKQNNKSKFVPNSIIYFNNFVEELFDPSTKNPRDMIKNYGAFLDFVSFGNKEKPSEFNTFFGSEECEDEVHEIKVEDLAGQYDMEDPPEDE
jgi:hypothetical protein